MHERIGCAASPLPKQSIPCLRLILGPRRASRPRLGRPNRPSIASSAEPRRLTRRERPLWPWLSEPSSRGAINSSRPREMTLKFNALWVALRLSLRRAMPRAWFPHRRARSEPVHRAGSPPSLRQLEARGSRSGEDLADSPCPMQQSLRALEPLSPADERERWLVVGRALAEVPMNFPAPDWSGWSWDGPLS